MSAGMEERLVAMANQIAGAFEGQGGDAVASTARHIREFWPRPMRDQIVRYLHGGRGGLTATAQRAVAEIAAAHGGSGTP